MNPTRLVPSPARVLATLSLALLALTVAATSAAASIDLAAQPQIRFQGQSQEWLGSYVNNQACDVNGDGYDDLLLSSEKWNGNAGELTVILGHENPSGGDITSPLTEKVVRIQGSGRFGGAVDCAGDVNNDGIDDLVVGAYQYAHGTGNMNRGSAWVMFGATDFEERALQFLPGNPGDTGFRIDGNGASATANDDGLGFGVAGIGDIDGDGYDDLLLSAHLADYDGLSNSGSAYIVKGKPGTAVVKLSDPTTWLAKMRGVRANAQMRGTTAVGDFNGDGQIDAAIGTNLDQPYSRGSLTGSVWVIDGNTRGDFSLNELDPSHANYNPSRGLRIAGAAGASIGQHIAGVGDVNGDGVNDLMTNAENATVIFGGGGNTERDLGAATWCDCGYEITGDGGSQVVGLGDLDNDGLADVAFGNKGAANSDAAYMTYGRAETTPLDILSLGLAQGSKLLPAAGSASAGSGSRFGTRVGKADFDGDGSVDLVVGASNANALGRTEPGEVTVVFMPPPAKPAISPASHAFGARTIGTGAGQAEQLTLTNEGGEPLVIDSIDLTGDDAGQFEIDADDCTGGSPGAGGRLAAEDSCSVQASFSPTGTGAKSAAVEFETNEGTVEAALTGEGIEPLFPHATVTPASHDFGKVRSDITGSATTTVTLTNDGDADLTVETIGLAGADAASFSIDISDCEVSAGVFDRLAVAGSCEVDVVFDPSTDGSKSATLSFDTDGGDRSVALAGTGVSPAGSAGPSTLAFGDVRVGQAGAEQQVTVSSNGSHPLTVESIELGGSGSDQFALDASDCGTSIEPGEDCEAKISFAPDATGVAAASLTVETDAGNYVTDLTGTGRSPVLKLTEDKLEFDRVTIGETAAVTRSVSIENTGDFGLLISGAVLAGADSGQFRLDSTACPESLAPAATCELAVTFAPDTAGSKAATLTVTTDGGNGTVQLAGEAKLPDVTGPGDPQPCLASPVTRIAGIKAAGKGRGKVLKTRIQAPGADRVKLSGSATFKLKGKRRSFALKTRTVTLKSGVATIRWALPASAKKRLKNGSRVKVSLRASSRPAAADCVASFGSVSRHQLTTRVVRPN